jgi:hypothetical protein
VNLGRELEDEWVPVASEVTTDRLADVSDASFVAVRSLVGGMLVCCFAVRNSIL